MIEDDRNRDNTHHDYLTFCPCPQCDRDAERKEAEGAERDDD